jgi:hypothetical protein
MNEIGRLVVREEDTVGEEEVGVEAGVEVVVEAEDDEEGTPAT